MNLDVVYSGLLVGSAYALVGAGFDAAFRPTNVFNFAQADIVMYSAMIAWAAQSGAHLPWLVCALIAVGVAVTISLTELWLAIVPIIRREAQAEGWIITTLAVSFILEGVGDKLWIPSPHTMSVPSFFSARTFRVHGALINAYGVTFLIGTIALVAGLEIAYRSKAGRALAALAEDREAASLRGIDWRRLTTASFAISGVVSGLAGIAIAPFLLASTALGPNLLVPGFAAIAVGGVGNVWGVLIAGYLIGITQQIGAATVAPAIQQSFVVLVMLVVLTIRPHGLLGRPMKSRRV